MQVAEKVAVGMEVLTIAEVKVEMIAQIRDKGRYDPDDRMAEGGMVKDLTKNPEYRGWKKMYEANPGVGSMHEKHPTFIKFYKQHERDKKKFGGLAGLLYD